MNNYIIYKINTFNKKIKNINLFFFFMGCSSLFFSCQLIKTSQLLVKNSDNYNNCFEILKTRLTTHNTKLVCEILNKRENFQNFVYNFFYTILLMYALIREVIKKKYLGLGYWFVAHLALIIYSLSGNYEMFQFSIDTKKKYSDTQLKIILICSIIIFILLIRQIYLKKIRYNMIFNFLLIYFVMYLLLLSITNKIIIHLHHAIVCGLLSFCFTDFKNNLDRYVHAFLIGITVQGFNMYSLSEIYMFYIDDISPPSFNYLCILYSVFIIFWFLLIFIRNGYYLNICNNLHFKNTSDIINLNSDIINRLDIQIPLIPSQEEIESFQKNN